MNKTDIALRIHETAGLSEHEAENILEWMLALFKSTLQRGEDITVAGFGRFRVRTKDTRLGRNPRTGEELQIPGMPGRHLSCHSALKDEVAGTQQSSTEQ